MRLGGIGLFDERFQFDSSVNWVFGESIEGELDALIPAWDSNGHVVFVQPGIVFWSGIEEEKRIDANLGAVYRTEVFDGIIGGVNLFYDNDFKMGHSRISVGVDAQMDDLYGAFNYYVPLTDAQDGREGYVEDALEGMDAILGIENEAVRFSGNVGYWTYQGDENTEDEMEFSYGIDGGIRIFPGFFLEGSLQQHDDASIGSRASVGVAVRFSLPDLTGKSYGDNGGVSNLYKFVERERRILYEERESHGIFLLSEGSVVEGGTVSVAVQLSKVAAEDVTLNFVGSGSATYGTDSDYTVSVGGTACTAVTGSSCSVTVATGETMPADNVVITINNDGRGEGAETIVLSTVVATGDTSLTGRPLVLTIPEDPPLARASIVRTGSGNVAEGDTVDLDIQLGEMLEEDVTVNLVGSDSTATYGSSNDWILSVGGTACTGVANDECQVSITAGQSRVTDDVVIIINDDGRTNELPENIVLSTTVDSGSTHLLQAGSPFTLTIPMDPPLPAVSISATGLSITEGGNATLTATLSEMLTEDVVINLLESGAADYGTGMDWHLNNGSDCNTATGTSCQITITAGQRSAMATINVNSDTDDEASSETFTVSINTASTFVTLGSPSSLNFTIPADPATVSLINGGNTGISRQSTPRMRIELNRAASQDITLNIVGTGSAVANYEVAGGTGTGRGGTWELQYRVLPAGGTLPAFFENGTACQSIAGTGCPIMIREGQTIVDIEIYVLLVPSGRDIILTLGIDQANSSFVTLGSSSSQTLTIN